MANEKRLIDANALIKKKSRWIQSRMAWLWRYNPSAYLKPPPLMPWKWYTGGGLPTVGLPSDALFATALHYEKMEYGMMFATATTAPTAVQRWMVMGVTKTTHYCDHCGKELDQMKDYLCCDIDVWCGEFQTDLCADCLNQLGRMVKDFCSYRERKDNE